jgi:magnesium transporter
MNRNIYYLTVLSGIFLPLTLIIGFFGMNIGGLLLADNENGTLYVVLISIVLEVLFLLPLLHLKLREKLIK